MRILTAFGPFLSNSLKKRRGKKGRTVSNQIPSHTKNNKKLFQQGEGQSKLHPRKDAYLQI